MAYITDREAAGRASFPRRTDEYERAAFEAGERAEADMLAHFDKNYQEPQIETYEDWVRMGRPAPSSSRWPRLEKDRGWL